MMIPTFNMHQPSTSGQKRTNAEMQQQQDQEEGCTDNDSGQNVVLPTRGGRGKAKIDIRYIEDKNKRHITFSKRKAGIMKKAYELSTLTGTQVLLLVASETGHVYTFATPKLQPLITRADGKNLIQECLNTPDHGMTQPDGEDRESSSSYDAHPLFRSDSHVTDAAVHHPAETEPFVRH